jgi:hypothetical protein
MKKIQHSFVLACLCLSFLMGCKKYETVEAPTPPQLMNKLWKLSLVTITENGVASTNVTRYNGFTMQFDGIKFFVSNGNEAFPKAEGTWGFDDNTYKTFTIDDGTQIQITELTASTLKFNFIRKGKLQLKGDQDPNEQSMRLIPTRNFSFELVPFK